MASANEATADFKTDPIFQRELPVSQEYVMKWVESARWTPSADNDQPWKVDWETGLANTAFIRIKVRAAITSTTSADALQQAMQTMALGSLGYSLKLLAEEDGFSLKHLEVFAGGANLDFHKLGPPAQKSIWAKLIEQRQTNRKVFSTSRLSASTYSWLQKTTDSYEGVRFQGFQRELSTVAKLLTKIDSIRYQNNWHLDHLLKALRFGTPETKSGEGLDVKCLEIPKAASLFFKLIRRWRFFRLAFFIGLERVFGYVGCQRLIEKSGDFIYLSARTNECRSWYDLGQCLQEIWLTATAKSLALHPFGHSFIFFDAHIHPVRYSLRHQEMVADTHAQFQKLGADLYKPGIFFRLGTCREAPAFKSNRREVANILVGQAPHL